MRVVTATFQGLTKISPTRPFFRELYDRFSEPEAWHIFDDVLPALRALASRGLKLGVISNWDRRLGPLLGRLGLRGYFEVVLVSCRVGAAKPSPAIFTLAAKKLALPPQAILHIGDSPEMDLHGARKAGLRALLLRRRPGPAAAGEITSLHDLYRTNFPRQS